MSNGGFREYTVTSACLGGVLILENLCTISLLLWLPDVFESKYLFLL